MYTNQFGFKTDVLKCVWVCSNAGALITVLLNCLDGGAEISMPRQQSHFRPDNKRVLGISVSIVRAWFCFSIFIPMASLFYCCRSYSRTKSKAKASAQTKIKTTK